MMDGWNSIRRWQRHGAILVNTHLRRWLKIKEEEEKQQKLNNSISNSLALWSEAMLRCCIFHYVSHYVISLTLCMSVCLSVLLSPLLFGIFTVFSRFVALVRSFSLLDGWFVASFYSIVWIFPRSQFICIYMYLCMYMWCVLAGWLYCIVSL